MLESTIRHKTSLVVAGLLSSFALISPVSGADPGEDALIQLSALSRKSERMTETLYSARLDLQQKQQEQHAAEEAHARDQGTLESANTRLEEYRQSVNNFAVTTYMGSSSLGTEAGAMLVAQSPTQLIDRISVERVVGNELGVQMRHYREATTEAVEAEQRSAASETEAREAAKKSEQIRYSLLSQQSRLRSQISSVKEQYDRLTEAQHAELSSSAPEPESQETILESAPAPDPPEAQLFNLDDLLKLIAPPPPGPEGSDERGATVVQAALTQVGSRYSWGGESPGSFDCSGLVKWAYRQAGVPLPHSSQAQSGLGEAVALPDMRPGDLVTYYSDASHVSMYVGDGQVIHAPTFGVPVSVVPLESSGPVHNVRRP